MTSAALTVELPEDERIALEERSKVEGRSVGELVHEAIKNYLGHSGPKEHSDEEMAVRLREYRRRDPEFRKAIAACVEAELKFDDPLEGVAVEGEFIDGKFVEFGPAQRKIREVLSA